MYLYNITINVNADIQEIFLDWLRKEHIPAVMDTGKFQEARLVLVSTQEEMGGTTYATQYTCESGEVLKEFYRDFAPKFHRELLHKFPNKVVIFGSELKVIESF